MAGKKGSVDLIHGDRQTGKTDLLVRRIRDQIEMPNRNLVIVATHTKMLLDRMKERLMKTVFFHGDPAKIEEHPYFDGVIFLTNEELFSTINGGLADDVQAIFADDVLEQRIGALLYVARTQGIAITAVVV